MFADIAANEDDEGKKSARFLKGFLLFVGVIKFITQQIQQIQQHWLVLLYSLTSERWLVYLNLSHTNTTTFSAWTNGQYLSPVGVS